MSWYRVIPCTLLVLVITGAPGSAADQDKKIDKDNKIPDELRTILENAGQFELLSLSPGPRQKNTEDVEAFHGWNVLGTTTVKDTETRKKLVAAFEKSVEENKGIVAACFNPRHGIRVTYDGKTADFVICFECFQVQAFVGDEIDGFLITNSPQSVFDAVLKEAQVPLPEKPQKK